MKYLGPYRIAAYLLVLFCIGHTAGGMLSQKSLGPEADAVFAAMKSVVPGQNVVRSRNTALSGIRFDPKRPADAYESLHC